MADQSQELFGRTKGGGSSFLKQADWTHLIFCFLIIGLHVLLLDTGRLKRLEYVFLDYFFRGRPHSGFQAADPNLAIIEIDEESIESVGNWPWPWHYHAQMIDVLSQWGAKAIVFDFPFRASEGPDEGGKLLAAVRSAGNVYTAVTLETKVEKKIWVHGMPIVLEPQSDQLEWIRSMPEIEAAVKGYGYSYLPPDEDGVLRKVSTRMESLGKENYLGMKAAYDVMIRSLPGVDFDEFTNRFETLQNQMMINWSGKYKTTFDHYAYAEVIRSFQSLQNSLEPMIKPEAFRGKICLIGFTAASLVKGLTTPLEPNVPPVGIHAFAIQNLIEERFIRPVRTPANLLTLIGIGLIASVLFTNFRNLRAFIGGLALGGLWLLIGFFLLWKAGIWIFVIHPVVLILSLFIFSALYHQIVSGREQSRLFDLATRDGLTGLYVIRHFREILNRVVLEARTNNECLSLVLIDIDDFKPINDTYGHPAGDMVLRKTAQVIHSVLRSQRAVHDADFVGRYGGEEFIVLLRKTDLKNAAQVAAERIRVAVEQTKFQWNHSIIPVTVSLGVAALHPNENVPDSMVHRADAALYKAKRSGKNKVCTEAETSI